MNTKFDMFSSYCRKDDLAEHAGQVTAVRDAIVARYRDVSLYDPRVIIFEKSDNVTGGDWHHCLLFIPTRLRSTAF